MFFRPVLVIGGSSDVDQESMGAFQEFPQVCKYSILLLCILFRVQWFEKALFAIITKKKEKKTYSQDRQLNPFTPKISLVIGEFGVGSTNNPLMDVFLYSHHLTAWHCVDTVKRNSLLVSHGS